MLLNSRTNKDEAVRVSHEAGPAEGYFNAL